MYAGNSAEILTAISQIATTIQPLGGYDYFSVTEVTPTQVTVRANPTIGMQLLAGNQPITATFTALQSGSSTSVSHFAKLGPNAVTPSSAIGTRIENVYKELATRFTMLP
jgi:hypothetical protein